MGQELELIVDILREMERVNSTNSQSFDNLLNGINSKIDVMGRSAASAELLKVCLEELAKNLDDKYSTTIARFSEIEKALKAVFNAQNEHVKTKEIKDLFDIFSNNLSNFYTESRQQRAILSGIETKLADISTDKSDKEDILRTISLLRNDFENLNHSYKNAIDNVNSDLKAILSNMTKLDQTELAGQINEQVEVMYKATLEIVNYLNSIDKRDANLEKILSNVATNESLKITQGVIDSIIRKSEEISEKLTDLADKTDIRGLESAASYMNNRLDNVVTKELFSKITSATDALINQTDEIKQTLAGVTKNIDSQPDTRMFEDALQNLFKKFDSLSQDINKLDSGENLAEIDTRVTAITNELSVIKNIASDINEAVASKLLSAIEEISFDNQSCDIKNHITNMVSELPQKEDIDKILENNLLNQNAVDTLIEKTDNIADRLDTLPTHQDMANLSNNQLSLVENLQEVAVKSDIEKLETKTDELGERIDKLNFDNEFGQLYDRTSSIENWLNASELREKSEEILSQFPQKANQKDILELIATTNNIVESIEELSRNTDAKKVNRTVAELYSMIEELKNDFVNTTEMHNDSIIVALSELQESASRIVTIEEFNNFVEDLKSFVVNNIDNNENIKACLATIKNQTSTVDSSIAAIKELLLAKNAEFETFSHINNQTLANIEKYIEEIKNTFSDSEISPASETCIHVLESHLKEFSHANDEYMEVLTSKLDSLIALSETSVTCNFESSLDELEEIKDQIKELGASFGLLGTKDSSNGNVSQFLSSKLEELSQDINNLSNDIEGRISNGFAYNAELIDEKTALLLDLIKELRHASSNNIDMYERLTVADNQLVDFKQELELVNTDIISNLNSSTETFINELAPIKEMVSNLLSNITKNSFDNMAEPIKAVQETIREDVTDEAALKKLDDIYIKISNEIAANETTIKDVILTDIDSVLIKIDSIKEELEDTIASIVPPDASEMIEFRNFAKEINSFRENQEKLFSELSDNITTTINEQFELQNKNLTSLFAISNNNEEILNAIENLKTSVVAKLNSTYPTDEFASNEYEKEFEQPAYIEEIQKDFEKFTKIIGQLSDQNSEITEVLNVLKDKINTSTPVASEVVLSSEDANINDFLGEETTSEDKFDIAKALELLQKDIKELHENVSASQPVNNDWLEEVKNYIAGDDIRSILTEINSKIDVLSMTDSTEWIEDIKDVITNLTQTDMGQIAEANNQIQSTLELINEKLDILSTADNFADFEEYNNQVQSTLELLDKKLDILSEIDNSAELEEYNNQVQSKLELLDKKLDIISETDNSAEFEDIRFSLDSIEDKLNSQDYATEKTLSESDAKITSMLEMLNQKIDILADFDDTDTQFALEDVKALILEQKDSIDKLDDNLKTNAFKKCLDELTFEINNISSNNTNEIQKTLKEMKDSITAAVVTIFEQVSFLEETEEIKDFVEEKTDEINKNLVEVTEQLKQIANTDTDYTYSMQDIESDLAKLRIALNELQASEQDASEEKLSFILDNINKIGSSVENLQTSIPKDDELFDLKIKLNEIAETSGESYNTIGRILTDHLSTKVDRVTQLIERSHDSDKVMRQALIYIGEWIDSASISMNKISTNSDEIVDVKSALESLKTTIPAHTNILNSIEEKFDEQQERLAYFEKQITKLANLEDRFEQQQERIDRLEMSLGKILTVLEDIDDSKVTRKIDKIDKQIAKLSTNIEKLASYVD